MLQKYILHLLLLNHYIFYFYILIFYHKSKFKLFKFINFTSASEICFAPSAFKSLELLFLYFYIFTINLNLNNSILLILQVLQKYILHLLHLNHFHFYFYILIFYHKFKFKLFKFINFPSASDIYFALSAFKSFPLLILFFNILL